MFLNGIALTFEILGFLLAAVDIYSPEYSHALNNWMNERSSSPHRFTTIRYVLKSRRTFQVIAIISLIIGFLTFSATKDTPLEYISAFSFTVVFFTVIFYVVLMIFLVAFLLLIDLYPKLFIKIATAIHPKKRTIGGAGILLGLIGVCIDLYQFIISVVFS